MSILVNPSEISNLLASHNHPLVLFSGGKDSIVLAHLLEPFKDKFSLVWVNTGAMLPHMEEFIREYGQKFNLVELSSNQAERFKTVGYPSFVIPIYNTPLAIQHIKGVRKAVINDWITCCRDLRSAPAMSYANSIGSTLIIHGQRGEDNGGFHEYGHDGNIDIYGLVFNWSNEDIYQYINTHKLKLPEQYSYSPESKGESLSFECWNCPANISMTKVNYMRDKYPELLAEFKPIIKAVYGSVSDELERCIPAINNLLDGDFNLQVVHQTLGEIP